MLSDYLAEKKMFTKGPEFWHVGFVSPGLLLLCAPKANVTMAAKKNISRSLPVKTAIQLQRVHDLQSLTTQ